MSGGLFDLLILVLIGALAGWLIFGIVKMSSPERMTRKEKRELERLQSLVEGLDNIAYENRELDSQLAVIIIDEIRKYRNGR